MATTAEGNIQTSLNYMYIMKEKLKQKILKDQDPYTYTQNTSKGIISELTWRHNFCVFKNKTLEELLTPTYLRKLNNLLITLRDTTDDNTLFDETDFDFANDNKLKEEQEIYATAERIIQRKIASAQYTSLKGKFIDQACCVVFVTNNDESERAVDALVHANKDSHAGIRVVNINELTESQKTELRACGDELPIIFIGEKQIPKNKIIFNNEEADYSIKDCTKSKSAF
jgi:hypothetical protein